MQMKHLIETHPYFKVGDYAHLSIEDKGSGLSEQQMEHMFEPFFTTKEQGKGTGLGLAMVYGAIKTHGGFIEAERIEESGTIFHIYLPSTQGHKTVNATTQNFESVQGHGEVILLVDDQDDLLEIGKEILESLGYQALKATNGKLATEVIEEDPEKVDLIILDVVMPVMGGSEAAKCIRQINSNIPIIFSTGYDKSQQPELWDYADGVDTIEFLLNL